MSSSSALALLTPANIGELRTTLNRTEMPNEQQQIMISLLQMLNKTDSEWNFEKCDKFVGQLVSDVTNGNLNSEQINKLMIEMANEAGAPIVSGTVLQVEWYRKTFLYLLAAGVSYATLQAYAPEVINLVYDFALDSAYSLYNAATTAGVTPETIIGKVITNPSPFSAEVASRASYNLVIATLSAGVTIAKTCGGAVGNAAQQLPVADCLKYVIHLLGLAIAENAAERAVETVSGVFTGDRDKDIADWLDKGGIEHTQAALIAAEQYVVDITKSEVKTSLDNMNKINSAQALTGQLTHVNDDITRWLDIYITQFQGNTNVALTTLITTLSSIDFNKTVDLEGIAKSLNVVADHDFRALIAAYTLATNKTTKPITISSQGDPIYNTNTSSDITRSHSLGSDYKYPEDPHNSKRTLFETTKTKTTIPFVDTGTSVVSELHVIHPLDKILRENKLLDTEEFTEDNLYGKIGQLPEDMQHELVDLINQTKTIPGKYNLNNQSIIRTILRVVRRYGKREPQGNQPQGNQTQDKDRDRVRDARGPNSMELGGRSGRPRKSRRYKKRRSTLKRRGPKRRRTRKGKKRRHTKKRR